jgi:hypothetical protein
MPDCIRIIKHEAKMTAAVISDFPDFSLSKSSRPARHVTPHTSDTAA